MYYKRWALCVIAGVSRVGGKYVKKINGENLIYARPIKYHENCVMQFIDRHHSAVIALTQVQKL